MFTTLRNKAPGSGVPRIVVYEICCVFLRAMFRWCFRTTLIDIQNVPASGSLLIAANHQSFLDPPLVGCFVMSRHFDFIARSGLFKFAPFAWLITCVNSIPIREDQGDSAAIKEAIRRLDAGRAVTIFPEGSRTPDGQMHEFKRGVALLVKKARCPVIPVALEGVFDAWPRSKSFPKLFSGRILVKYGKPIPYDELMKDGADAALARLHAEIDVMRLDLRIRLREMTGGRIPAPGPGDQPAAKLPTGK